MKEYKIEPSRIKEYIKRNDSRVFKILIFTMIGMPFLMFPMTQQEGAPKDVIWIMLGSLLFTTLIVGLIYLNNKKLTRLSAENLKIEIDDVSITRIIDLDNESRMNFLHKNAYQRAKNISGSYYSKIDFSDLKSVEIKKGNLWIKSTKSNSFNGKNIVLVPRELKNFNEVERTVKEKLK